MPKKKSDKIQFKQGSGAKGLNTALADAGDIVRKFLGLYEDPTAIVNRNEFTSKNPVYVPAGDVYKSAEVPEFEDLVKKGIIKKAENLLGKDIRGYFLDPVGDVYDLGSFEGGGVMNSLTHPQALVKSKLYKGTEDEMLPTEWTKILKDKGLIRVRNFPDSSHLEMASSPTFKQLDRLFELMDTMRYPRNQIGMDLRNPGARSPKDYLGKYTSDPTDVMNTIYEFFK